MKATHNGHCQVCGRKQKLPNGKLAKHGYKVANYGFFNGTCFGSENLPFEQDKTLVEQSIAWAYEQAESNDRRAEEIRASLDTVWVHEYNKSKVWGRGGNYVWRELPVAEVKLGYNTTWTGQDGKQQSTSVYDCFWNKAENRKYTPEEQQVAYVKYLNDKRALEFNQTAKQLRSYAKDQERRLEGWKPQPLEEIK